MLIKHHVHESQIESYFRDNSLYDVMGAANSIKLIKRDTGLNRVVFNQTVAIEYDPITCEYTVIISVISQFNPMPVNSH